MRPGVRPELALCLALAALALGLSACSSRRGSEGSPYALPGESGRREPGLVHTVGKAESWASLAEDYYGDPDRRRALRRANRELGDTLEPGERVFIPMSERERMAFEERALARAPYNKGLELARRGDFPAAIMQFQESLRLDPRLARAHYNLGLVYLRAGQPAKATASLERACALQPAAEHYYGLGSAWLERAQVKQAERAFRHALDQDPWHLPSLYALARSLEGRDPREAAELWRRVLALDPHGPRGQEASRALGLAP